MGYALSDLFDQLNSLGIALRRNVSGELEITGNTALLTDAMKQAINEYRGMILACVPHSPADNIRRQIDDFGKWLQQFAWWAQEKYLDSIDYRLSEAVDTQQVEMVSATITTLKSEVEAINWAVHILPRSVEVEAKHTVATGAGLAAGSVQPRDIPF